MIAGSVVGLVVHAAALASATLCGRDLCLRKRIQQGDTIGCNEDDKMIGK